MMDEKKEQLEKVRRAFHDPSCAGKSGLYTGGTAGALCIHCTGGFPCNHWKRGKKKGQMTLNR